MKVQINEENNYKPIRVIMFWTGFNFSVDKLTEKQDLICPLIFTEIVKEKKYRHVRFGGD